jgi:tetratricopeptide (TPR) repeat protein
LPLTWSASWKIGRFVPGGLVPASVRGAGAGGILRSRSRREAIEALADAQTQRKAAETRRIEADEARQLAEKRADDDRRNFRWARRTVDKYLTEVSEDPLLKAHGMEPLRQRLLETARQFYDEFVNVRTDDSRLQLDRAKAYRQLASISDDVGDKTHALELLSKSRAILQKASTEDVDPIELRFESATNHKVTGKIHFKLGQFPEAQVAYERSLKLLRELTRDRPQDQIRQRSLADVLGKLGVTHLKTGRVREAEALLDEAVTTLDLLVAENPHDAENQEELASVHSKRSILYALTERPGPSGAAQRRAIEIREHLVKQHPLDPHFREKLAVDYMNAANRHSAAGRNTDALSSIKTSLEMLRRLRDSHPNVELYQVNLAHGYRSLGRVYAQMRQIDEVETSYREAAAICKKLIRQNPDADIHREALATIWSELEKCCERLDRPEQAKQARQEANAVRQMRQ